MNATHTFPYPVPLEQLLANLNFRKDTWKFELTEINDGQGRSGLFLKVHVLAPDTTTGAPTKTLHRFPIPPAVYNEATWQRWLFEKILQVLSHEAAEEFEINGIKPYYPRHRPGFDPYNL